MYHKCDLVKCQILQKCNLNDRCTVKCFKLYTSKGFNIYTPCSLWSFLRSHHTRKYICQLSIWILGIVFSLPRFLVARADCSQSRFSSFSLAQFDICRQHTGGDGPFYVCTGNSFCCQQFIFFSDPDNSCQSGLFFKENLDLWKWIDNIYI